MHVVSNGLDQQQTWALYGVDHFHRRFELWSLYIMVAVGQQVGAFEIVALLGRGGMGEVWRARDTRLGREVALKVLSKAFTSDAGRLRRFQQEAKTLAALNHPNLLTIFEVGQHQGEPYLVSELLEGRTLREEVKAGRMEPQRAVGYALQFAHGLAAAHAKGVIHRDLKPENLFVTRDGRIKILDFGLAKLHESSAGEAASTDSTEAVTLMQLTTPGMLIGTPGYMAPEQVRGKGSDERSDIFAFGAILHEMLTGHRPFKRDTAVETLNAILKEAPPELKASLPNISPMLERTVLRCLEKDPANRFQTVKDLAFAIENADLAFTGKLERTYETRFSPRWLQLRSHRLPSSLRTLLIVLFTVGISLGFGWWLWRMPEQEPGLRRGVRSLGTGTSLRAYEAALKAGRTALERGDYPQAVKHAKEALNINPAGAEALELKNRAEAAAKNNQKPKDANDGGPRSLLVDAQTRESALKDAMEAGASALGRSNYLQAVEAFQRALQLKPDDPSAKKQLADAQSQQTALINSFEAEMQAGRRAMDRANYAEAANDFQRASQLRPSDESAKKELADARARQAALDLAFNNAMEAGRRALQRSNYLQAIEQFRMARQLNVTNAEATAGLAEAQKKQSDLDLAFKNAMQAGQTALQQSNYVQAIDYFQQAVQLNPNDGSAKTSLTDAQSKQTALGTAFSNAMQAGRAELQRSNYVQAIEHFKRAGQLKPGDASAQNALTEAQAGQAELQRAFAQAIMDGNDAMAKTSFSVAVNKFQRAVDLKPGDEEAARFLSEARKGATGRVPLDKVVQRLEVMFGLQNEDPTITDDGGKPVQRLRQNVEVSKYTIYIENLRSLYRKGGWLDDSVDGRLNKLNDTVQAWNH
jgi:serine/threonine protein kinase/Flp pilus assembly protein TadD